MKTRIYRLQSSDEQSLLRHLMSEYDFPSPTHPSNDHFYFNGHCEHILWDDSIGLDMPKLKCVFTNAEDVRKYIKLIETFDMAKSMVNHDHNYKLYTQEIEDEVVLDNVVYMDRHQMILPTSVLRLKEIPLESINKGEQNV